MWAWAGLGGMAALDGQPPHRAPTPPADYLHPLLLPPRPCPQVDVQSTIGLLGSGLGGGPATAATYHASLEASTRRHFPGNHLINCMCHSSEDLYR